MKEEDLYPIIQRYLEKELGYFPVRTEPLIRIHDYKPDVTGIKGKKIITVEAKISFNPKLMMEAVTQAKVYSIGSTHAYVAFPSSAWTKGEEQLHNLCKEICENEGIGIYLVDINKETIEEKLEAKFSKYFNLERYEKTINQLEGDKELKLFNTFPEYVRDICIFISQQKTPMTRDVIIQNLLKVSKNQYWTKRSGDTRSSEEVKAKNRIEAAINGALSLGFLSEDSTVENGKKRKILLTRDGHLFVRLSGTKMEDKTPAPLTDDVRAFLSAYLLKFPIINKAREILEKRGEILFGKSVCNCKEGSFSIKDFDIVDDSLVCKKCQSKVKACFIHQLLLEYGDKECYHELKFTKTLGKEHLLLFEFGKITNLDSIKLRE